MSLHAANCFAYIALWAWWSFFKLIFDLLLFALCSFCSLLFKVTIRIPLHEDSSKSGRYEISFQTGRLYFYHFPPKMKPKIKKPQVLCRPPCLCVFETEGKHYRTLFHSGKESFSVVTGWSTIREFNFRQTFMFIFYRALRPVLSLTETSGECVCVWGGGEDGLILPPVLSHTRQGDHWHSCSEENAWSYTPAPSYVLVTGRNTWYVTRTLI